MAFAVGFTDRLRSHCCPLTLTFAKPPPGIAARLDDFSKPRKMEFKGCVPENERCSQEGLTNNEVTNFINDWQKMGPDEDRTRDLADQDFVNVWFKGETKLATMIGSDCWS